jgi:hypothetical protein
MNHTFFRRSLSFILALAAMLIFCTAAFAAEQTTPATPSDTPGFTLVEIKGTDVVMEGNEFPYTGQPIEPNVTVTVDGKELIRDQDYTVTYINNLAPGTGTLTVKGIATASETLGYYGKVSMDFTIVKTDDPETPTQPDAPQTEPTQSPKPAATTQDQLKELLQGGLVKEFVPIVRLMLELLDDFRWKLRVKRIELQVVLACDDPCDLAVLYGQAWSAVGNLFPVLERSMVIKKRNIEVLCDFMADKTRVKARLDLTITIGRLLLLGGKHGFRFLLKFIDIYKSIKGGAKNEPNSSQYA